MPSEHFTRFYASCFENSFHAVHDGLDYEALRQFNAAEQRQIIRLLLQALGTPIDTHSRPVIALGYLRVKEAARILEERLVTSSGYDRVETALALYRINTYPPAIRVVVDVLAQTPLHESWIRMRAVEALGEFPPLPAVAGALQAALMDGDGMVRYLAADALKRLYKDDPDLIRLLIEIQQAGVGPFVEPEWESRRQGLCAEAAVLIQTRGFAGSVP